jgi:hypothetical protein
LYHPLSLALIREKWRVGWYCYFSFLTYYLTYVIVLTYYMTNTKPPFM